MSTGVTCVACHLLRVRYLKWISALGRLSTLIVAEALGRRPVLFLKLVATSIGRPLCVSAHVSQALVVLDYFSPFSGMFPSSMASKSP